MNKNQRSPTGRRPSRPELQNISPELLPHQREAFQKIKKALNSGPFYVSVKTGHSI